MISVLGNSLFGDSINPYYSVSVASVSDVVMSADIVRRNLRIHYAKISNLEIRDFVLLVNNNVSADLSSWGMSSFANLTDGQKANLRLYYSYVIGEMIFLHEDETKLYERMKLLKKQIFSKLTTLSSGSYEYELERISNTNAL